VMPSGGLRYPNLHQTGPSFNTIFCGPTIARTHFVVVFAE
jgi:hypothetical protein